MLRARLGIMIQEEVLTGMNERKDGRRKPHENNIETQGSSRLKRIWNVGVKELIG